MPTRTVLQSYITKFYENNARFALEIGMSEDEVDVIVAGGNISVRQQRRWAKALGTTVKTLFGNDSYLRKRI